MSIRVSQSINGLEGPVTAGSLAFVHTQTGRQTSTHASISISRHSCRYFRCLLLNVCLLHHLTQVVRILPSVICCLPRCFYKKWSYSEFRPTVQCVHGAANKSNPLPRFVIFNHVKNVGLSHLKSHNFVIFQDN